GADVGVLRHRDGVGGRIPRPVPPGALDAVVVVEAAVEPHRAVEGGLLVYEEVGELLLEGLRRLFVGEVPAELLAGLADGVGDAVDELADRALALLGIAVEPRLTEVLGDGDVRGELRPRSEERRVGKECRSRWSP